MARGMVRKAAPLAAALFIAALLPGPARAQREGVTLFSGAHLTGASQSFQRDVYDLDDTRFGSNRASSVAVAPGCRVFLFERTGFRGRSIELREDDRDLGNTPIGRGSVSSIKVECSSGGWGGGGGKDEGVTLFRDRSRTGPYQTFARDVPDLERTTFGARRASSVDVTPGCVATLFSEPGYRGRSTTFTEADNNLRNTDVGEDSASSLRVSCRGQGPGPRPEPDTGVTLYLYRNRTGPAETFDRDVPDLARTSFGARRANSLDITGGCVATLFSEPGYRGRSTTFRDADNNLGNTDVGASAAQSLRVDCGGGGGHGGGGRPPSDPSSPDRPGERRGVTLFRDRRLSGPSETFSADVPDLSRTRLGARTASSLAVSPGCVATVYSEPGYRGRATSFREADNDLSRTPLGDDAASSVRVSCR